MKLLNNVKLHATIFCEICKYSVNEMSGEEQGMVGEGNSYQSDPTVGYRVFEFSLQFQSF